MPFSDYFSYVHRWEEVIGISNLPIHVLYYEDLKSVLIVLLLSLVHTCLVVIVLSAFAMLQFQTIQFLYMRISFAFYFVNARHRFH